MKAEETKVVRVYLRSKNPRDLAVWERLAAEPNRSEAIRLALRAWCDPPAPAKVRTDPKIAELTGVISDLTAEVKRLQTEVTMLRADVTALRAAMPDVAKLESDNAKLKLQIAHVALSKDAQRQIVTALQNGGLGHE
jgi:outer membrane murein-binding lipoprotein Lpp